MEMEFIQEVWKDVLGFEGVYQVSDFGRVRSLDRVIPVSNGKPRHYKGRLMKQSVVMYGHMVVILQKGGVIKTKYVGRLVAEAFLPNPNNLEHVHHKDINASNNHVSNLEWKCSSEHVVDHGIERRRAIVPLPIVEDYSPPPQFRPDLDLSAEIWKPLLGLESYFEISNQGRIKRLGGARNRSGRPLFVKEKIIKTSISPQTGYQICRLICNNKRFSFPLHRLIAIHFIPNLENLPFVHHKDNNKLNNTIDNLQWVDQAMHNALHKTHHSFKRGALHPNSKINEDIVKQIRRASEQDKLSMDAIANLFNIGRSTVCSVLHKRTWRHVDAF